jgi:SAM-dependent methyltransferase
MIGRLLPEPIKRWLKRIRYRGEARYCPICASSTRGFQPFGAIPRPDARCPVCGSLERHRLLWIFLQQRTDFFQGRPRRMLHVGPEPLFERVFRRLPNLDYVSADLDSPYARLKMDIQRIQFPDACFDVVQCSHVLEHVEDDRKAMRELRRVLKPEGWALLLVPITAEATIEDLSIRDPARREQVFGKSDHVRRYGRDFPDRLREAGFQVESFGQNELVEPSQRARLAIGKGDRIFFCTRGKS